MYNFMYERRMHAQRRLHAQSDQEDATPWKLKHTSIVVYEIFEYMYGVLLFGIGLWSRIDPICNVSSARYFLWLCNRFETFMLIEVNFPLFHFVCKICLKH
jgi:hypothetical protein